MKNPTMPSISNPPTVKLLGLVEIPDQTTESGRAATAAMLRDGVDGPTSDELATRDLRSIGSMADGEAAIRSATNRGRQLLADVHGGVGGYADEGADAVGMVTTVGGTIADFAGATATEFALGVGGVGATVVGTFAMLGGAHLDALKSNVDAGARDGYAVGVAVAILGKEPSNYARSTWGQNREATGRSQAFNGAMAEGIEVVRHMSQEDRATLEQALLDDMNRHTSLGGDPVFDLARAVKRNI